MNATESPPNFHNYLDEFLEAVRVFGFLEKPVGLYVITARNKTDDSDTLGLS